MEVKEKWNETECITWNPRGNWTRISFLSFLPTFFFFSFSSPLSLLFSLSFSRPSFWVTRSSILSFHPNLNTESIRTTIHTIRLLLTQLLPLIAFQWFSCCLFQSSRIRSCDEQMLPKDEFFRCWKHTLYNSLILLNSVDILATWSVMASTRKHRRRTYECSTNQTRWRKWISSLNYYWSWWMNERERERRKEIEKLRMLNGWMMSVQQKMKSSRRGWGWRRSVSSSAIFELGPGVSEECEHWGPAPLEQQLWFLLPSLLKHSLPMHPTMLCCET